MARREALNTRATEVLNLALHHVSAAAEVFDHLEVKPEHQTIAAAARQRMSDAIDEAQVALANIRRISNLI